MPRRLLALLTLLALAGAGAQPGPAGGNLYVAGGGFDFATTVDRALAQNPNSRFFLLVRRRRDSLSDADRRAGTGRSAQPRRPGQRAVSRV